MIISRSVLLRMKNSSEKLCRENKNARFVFRVLYFFFEKNLAIYKNVDKYSTAEQATDDNKAHAHYRLNT